MIPEQLIGKTEITQKAALFLIGDGPPQDQPRITQLFDHTQPMDANKTPVLKLAANAPPSEWAKFRMILQQFQDQARLRKS